MQRFLKGRATSQLFEAAPIFRPGLVADLFDLRASVVAFSALAAYRGAPLVVSKGGSDPEGIQGVAVTADFFSTLGIVPIAGELWPADADAPPVPAQAEPVPVHA